jgi:hypothetical protein
LFHYDFSTLIFNGVLGNAYYICDFLIQDRVIKKVVVIMKVAVIGMRNIVVAFIYIIMRKILSRTAHR